MPIIVNMDAEAARVTLRVEGQLTLVDYLAGLERMYADPRFDPAMDILVELDPGVSSGLTSVEISGILRELRDRGALRGTGRTALIASNETDHGMLSLLSHVLQQGPRVMQVFHARDAALRWLDR